jgi:hypothetical protein
MMLILPLVRREQLLLEPSQRFVGSLRQCLSVSEDWCTAVLRISEFYGSEGDLLRELVRGEISRTGWCAGFCHNGVCMFCVGMCVCVCVCCACVVCEHGVCVCVSTCKQKCVQFAG